MERLPLTIRREMMIFPSSIRRLIPAEILIQAVATVIRRMVVIPVAAVRVAALAVPPVVEAAVVVDMNTFSMILAWDLSGPRERVQSEQAGWTETRLNRAITGYRQFLFIRASYPDTRLVPHVDVDEVWHSHILYTRDYAMMCNKMFGEFFHHNPSPGGKPTTQDHADYQHTRALIRHHFGVDKDPSRWLGEVA